MIRYNDCVSPSSIWISSLISKPSDAFVLTSKIGHHRRPRSLKYGSLTKVKPERLQTYFNPKLSKQSRCLHAMKAFLLTWPHPLSLGYMPPPFELLGIFVLNAIYISKPRNFGCTFQYSLAYPSSFAPRTRP